MIFFVYFLLNLLTLIFFFKFQKKYLHSLEIFVLWLSSSMLFQNYSALLFMNFKFFVIPNDLSIEMAHFMNRVVLIPLMTIILLNRYIVRKTYVQKTIWIFFCVIVFAGFEGVADFNGVLKHVHWRIWWSVEFWFVYMILVVLVVEVFRKRLVKEVGRA